MSIMAALVTGSILYSGARSYYKHRRRRTTVWLIEDGHSIKTSATVIEDPDLDKLDRRATFNFNLATFSLGLTTAGVLIYAPLIVASLPFNIFDTIIMFEDTWDTVLAKDPFGGVLVSSSIVAVTLLAHLHLLAALLQWLYFLNQKLMLVIMRSDLGAIINMMQQGATDPNAAPSNVWYTVPQ